VNVAGRAALKRSLLTDSFGSKAALVRFTRQRSLSERCSRTAGFGREPTLESSGGDFRIAGVQADPNGSASVAVQPGPAVLCVTDRRCGGVFCRVLVLPSAEDHEPRP
jgi:hypothetical protein